MHRTQIYFEQDLFNQVKQMAVRKSQSTSAYIRDVLRTEIEREATTNNIDVSDVLGMWSDYNISQKSLRSKAWGKGK
ncbi:hypothetical protein [Candidatus Thiodubiliella endoseptemdiera]|uniref:CopG family transcriptional regulator n=1 Tax=Candidatus Thiodubiliella endoseptemdiera TaxID=2738886 RepID=A0A853EZP7_9GAMM|nr:hypothetical protein [Candidatus Thiodubiliella endoseptemdiera]